MCPAVSCCPDLLAALLAWISDLSCGSVPEVDLGFMLSGPISSCSWQEPRADMLPHLVQDCRIAHPWLRTVRWCLLAMVLPMLGSLSALPCLPLRSSGYWHSSTFQHFLYHKKWSGCEVKKNKPMLGTYKWVIWKSNNSINSPKTSQKSPHQEVLPMRVRTLKNRQQLICGLLGIVHFAVQDLKQNLINTLVFIES